MLNPTPIAAVVSLSVASLLAQAIQPTPTSVLDFAERVTLSGALLAAVFVLWRTVSKKDHQAMELTKHVSEALVSSTDSNREIRTILQESVVAKRELTAAIDRLHVELKSRPCMADEEPHNSKRK